MGRLKHPKRRKPPCWINGKDRLACKTLVQDVASGDGATVTVDPQRFYPVLKDLISDQSSFFKRYRAVSPFLINNEPVGEKERLQAPEEVKQIEDSSNCILCTACMSSCPIYEKNPAYLGPGIIVQASRFNKDSRDRGFEESLKVLNDPNGVWPCENHFECTRCCPREIKVTKLINETKQKIKTFLSKETKSR